MNPLSATMPINKSKLFIISLIAVVPFVLLQIVFLLDSYSRATFLFGYMGIMTVAPIVFFGWCIYCFIEYRVRVATYNNRFPSFAIVGSLFLLMFFIPTVIVNPILLKFPQFCRVTQSIEWSTSKLDSKWKSKERFILVLIGSGTEESHRFSTGYMNWTGNEPAGFTSIDFQPISFQQRYHETNKIGSIEYLRSRISNSGISKNEVEIISNDIWELLNNVGDGNNVKSRTGVVNGVYCHVDDDWDYTIGGWVWIFTVILFFQFIGFRTIIKGRKKQVSG